MSALYFPPPGADDEFPIPRPPMVYDAFTPTLAAPVAVDLVPAGFGAWDIHPLLLEWELGVVCRRCDALVPDFPQCDCCGNPVHPDQYLMACAFGLDLAMREPPVVAEVRVARNRFREVATWLRLPLLPCPPDVDARPQAVAAPLP